jgi:hypothetical protein
VRVHGELVGIGAGLGRGVLGLFYWLDLVSM